MSQRFQIDGVPVVGCEGVFARRFDMDQADSEEVVYDETYVLVVVCTTLPPGFRTDKTGDLIRVNRFEVAAAKVAKGGLGGELAEMFDLDLQPKLPFNPPAITAPTTSAPPTNVPAMASQTAMAAPITVPTQSAASVAGTLSGTPVGAIAPTEDEELRRFLEGGA